VTSPATATLAACGTAPRSSPTRIDVRYWADGLGKEVSGPNAGKIDRKAAFTAVDNAFLANGGTNNFFGTTKVLGTYAAGDSRADIANALGLTTPGFLPIGADGNDGIASSNDNRIDAFDVDYISRQINTAADRQVNWETNLDEAALADLSADVTGDRIIDCNDVTEVVTVILGTTITDINLDGVANAADASIATTNLGTVNAVWSQGDVNCDGLVTSADVDLINGAPRLRLHRLQQRRPLPRHPRHRGLPGPCSPVAPAPTTPTAATSTTTTTASSRIRRTSTSTTCSEPSSSVFSGGFTPPCLT
jgi:hypothetical protein